ncbi:MAG TPA: carboxypeptidase regulatory-like domain-containing protein, partial [candidate division Zixibacteria bacterium]|nr:carboxypeptidase regulatory-like domain-containing protein [candidate division Zixibacteria bacterium]
ATNNGKSEIWTFACAVDTTTPVELRRLAGQVRDGSSGTPLDSATIVYRAVDRKVNGSDTTWTEQEDSLVSISGADGSFRFDSTLNKSFFSVTASRRDYRTLHLVGQNQYQDGNIDNFGIRLELAPPGNRRLAGVLRDFYSNEPVPNVTVTYHVVDAETVVDDSGSNHIAFVENPRKSLTALTDSDGRFEFTQAADSSFFSLRASNPPSYLDAVEMGPDQRQVGDIDDYIMLVKPNAGNITGTLQTTIGGKVQPVAKTVVRLVRTTVLKKKTTIFGISSLSREERIDTTDVSAYSDASGFFNIRRISQEKPTTVTYKPIPGFFFGVRCRVDESVDSYSYRVLVNDNRFQPYLSTDRYAVEPGETTETGEHLLTHKAGSIVGTIACDSIPVEGATVYLYQAAYHRSGGGNGQSGGSLGMKGGLGSSQSTVANDQTIPANDSTWGDDGSQRPEGDPIDLYQTDATGAYAFRSIPINDPGQVTDQYVIWVEGNGFNPAAKGDRIEAENEVDTVNVGLTRVGGIIYGQITAPDGTEIGDTRIELHQLSLLNSDTASSQSTVRWVASGGDGSYSFANILPGMYRLSFSKVGYDGIVTDTFSVNYGDNLLLNETLNAAKGFIALTVTDKDGNGLSDVCVKSPEIPSLIGFTDSNGKLLIIDAVADSVTLQLRKLSYEDLDMAVLVPANDTVSRSVTLNKSVGQILVRVVEKGNPDKRLPNMTVQIGKTEDKNGSLKKTTDVSGEATFPDCPIGQQTITVTPPTDSTYDQDYVVAETQLRVHSGLNAQPAEIEMVPAARMQGSVRDKEGGGPIDGVTVSIEGNGKIKAITDATGTFRMRNVPPGASVTLTAFKCGFRSARFTYKSSIAAGDKITGISIELEKSPMDSLFGFPVALDSVKSGSNGHSRVWGSILNVPPTFGLKLRNEAAQLTFANLEVDSSYRPIGDSVSLVEPEVEVDLFALDGKLSCEGGLCLQWVDSVQAGRIGGTLTIFDPISKAFSETKFFDLVVPRKYAPSFWAGGINRGLSKYGITTKGNEAQVQIKAVTLGLDFAQSNIDSTGLRLFGSIQFGSSFNVGFENLLIGRNAAGDIALKSVTLNTAPAIKIPFGVFTVVDSSMTWEATGFRASGAIVLNALENREFGFNDLRISPKGEFLSLTVTADEKNGTLNVYGQRFQIESIGFGTENFESDSLERVKFFTFAGKLSVKQLDKPVGMSLRYTEKGLFTGKLEFNQSRTFGKIVTITLESIELGYDSTKADRFVGFSGGVRFSAIAGLNLQANNLRFYFSGGVSFDEMAMQFIAG